MGIKRKILEYIINSAKAKKWIQKYSHDCCRTEVNPVLIQMQDSASNEYSCNIGRCVIGKNTMVHSSTQIYNYLSDPAAITIGSNSNIVGKILNYPSGGKVVIGDDCFFGEGSKIFAAIEIIIGNKVLIAHNVDIYDHNVHPIDPEERSLHYKSIISGENLSTGFNWDEKPIKIGDNAWIGAKSIILKGVTVGECAIVAAGSVVTKDVAPYTIVAGNPAKKVKDIPRK